MFDRFKKTTVGCEVKGGKVVEYAGGTMSKGGKVIISDHTPTPLTRGQKKSASAPLIAKTPAPKTVAQKAARNLWG